MFKRAVLGASVAAVAAAATTAVVLGVTSDGGDSPKQPPTSALQPGQITKIPAGTTLPEGATAPVEYGGFRILPQASVSAKCPPPGRAISERGKVEVSEAKTATGFERHELFVDPPYIPPGWQLTEAHAESTTWPDGTTSGTLFSLSYERAGYFPISITRMAVDTGCPVELVSFPKDGGSVYTLSSVAGKPAVIQHQAPGHGAQVPLEVQVRDGDVLTVVEGRAIDIDELILVTTGVLEAAR